MFFSSVCSFGFITNVAGFRQMGCRYITDVCVRFTDVASVCLTFRPHLFYFTRFARQVSRKTFFLSLISQIFILTLRIIQ